MSDQPNDVRDVPSVAEGSEDRRRSVGFHTVGPKTVGWTPYRGGQGQLPKEWEGSEGKQKESGVKEALVAIAFLIGLVVILAAAWWMATA